MSVNIPPMTTRTRPSGCCVPKAPRALPRATQDRLVAAFRALADPTRLEILRLIAAQPAPTCACDVVDHFDLAQPTISHHLKILREAGLLRASRRGIWSFYEADPKGLDLLGGAAALLRAG
jgi:ArsR family transcriptional regulator, arsenate/arsenite/antimonite-responsive transcriptional repressor